MNFHIIKTIFFKEVKDTIRDSKTIVIMILLPIVLYPLLAVGGGQIMIEQGKKIAANIVSIYIDRDNVLYDFLKKDHKIRILKSENPKRDVKSGRISAYIKIPPDFAAKLNNEKTIPLEIFYDQASINSLHAQAKITEKIKNFNQEVIKGRIAKRGLNKELLDPFDLTLTNIAPKEKIGGFYLGNILPFLIIFMTILGAFYPAIDQTAGEKERGTLETLLTTPVNKYDIITGKFLTISLFAFITGLLNLGSMTLSMTLMLSSDKINFSIPWSSMFFIFLTLIPTTMFFVAIMMFVSTLANSFKDAQNYLTPVYLICGFPAMVTVFPGFGLNYTTAMIPIANVSLLIKDLLLGKFDTYLIFIVMVTTTLYSILAIAAAAKLFNREDVLLAEESNLKMIFSSQQNRLNKVPNFLEAIFLYIITFGLLFYVGSSIQATYKLNGLLITELLLVLFPAVLFVRYLKFDFKETFSLRKVNIESLFGSFLLALSGSFFILKFVNVIQDKILPMPEELKKAFDIFLMENGQPPSFIKLFLIIAVSAAICEEMLFRGPLMAGINSKFNKPLTVVIVGILFGLFHLNVYKLIPTSVLGMLITYIALSTGSIFNGMFFHLVNNGSAIILGSEETGQLWFAHDSAWYYYPIFTIFLIAGIYFIKKAEKMKVSKSTSKV